ncbi:MAG: DUF3168 domain-containing protein [Pseudomonadota bacterium]
MSFPPIFAAVNVTEVQALLKTGQGELRFYLFGKAPQKVALPYAVWRQSYGSPENFIDQRPDTDGFGVQVDVYAANADDARAVAMALRDAIETKAYITAWRGESRDPDTNNFVFSFDSDWLTPR